MQGWPGWSLPHACRPAVAGEEGGKAGWLLDAAVVAVPLPHAAAMAQQKCRQASRQAPLPLPPLPIPSHNNH